MFGFSRQSIDLKVCLMDADMKHMDLKQVKSIIRMLVMNMSVEELRSQNTKQNTAMHMGVHRGNAEAMLCLVAEVKKLHGQEAWVRCVLFNHKRMSLLNLVAMLLRSE